MSQTQSNTHLSNQTCIKQFCECFESDQMLINELHYPDSVHVTGADHPEEYAKLLVVAMLLRKYFQKGENVKINSVITSIRKCLPSKKTLEVRRKITCLTQHAPQWGEPRRSGTSFQIEGCDPRDSTDLLTDMLYGSAMHGDYEKAERIRNWPLTSRCAALNETNKTRYRGVESVYNAITQWRTEKILDL